MRKQSGPIDDANNLINQLFGCAANNILYLTPILDVYVSAYHHSLPNQLNYLHQP